MQCSYILKHKVPLKTNCFKIHLHLYHEEFCPSAGRSQWGADKENHQWEQAQPLQQISHEARAGWSHAVETHLMCELGLERDTVQRYRGWEKHEDIPRTQNCRGHNSPSRHQCLSVEVWALEVLGKAGPQKGWLSRKSGTRGSTRECGLTSCTDHTGQTSARLPARWFPICGVLVGTTPGGSGQTMTKRRASDWSLD